MSSKRCFNSQTSNQLSRALCVTGLCCLCHFTQIPSWTTTKLKKSACALAQTRTSCGRTECPSIRRPKSTKILGIWLEYKIVSIEPLLKHKWYPLQIRTLAHFSGRQWYRLPWIFLLQCSFPHQCSDFPMERGSGPGKVSGEPGWRSVWGTEWLGCRAGEGTTSLGDHRTPGWFLTSLACSLPHVSTSHSSHLGANPPVIALWANEGSEKALRTPAHLPALKGEITLFLLPASASSRVEYWPENFHHFTAISCMSFGLSFFPPPGPTGLPYFRDSAGFVHCKEFPEDLSSQNSQYTESVFNSCAVSPRLL